MNAALAKISPMYGNLTRVYPIEMGNTLQNSQNGGFSSRFVSVIPPFFRSIYIYVILFYSLDLPKKQHLIDLGVDGSDQ